MMYLNFFGLRTKPFNTTPDPEFLYLSPSHKQALGSIIYGVQEKKGFISVTGQVGLGKTTILRSFLAKVDKGNLRTIYLLNPNLSYISLLKTLLRELGHAPTDGDTADVIEQLHIVLIEEYRKGKTVVLLIDEAQNMPVATLEHLRMLSNLETPKDKLIQIVLLGQSELDGLLDRYELRQVRQRIAVQAMIRPLSKQESCQYIQHRLDKAGGKGKKFFTNSALALIVREGKGIPRRLNILCDNALVTAFGYKKAPVTASIAKEVISDLTGQSQSSHSPWKLVPWAAGALILVLVLASLMFLTPSEFSDIPPLNEIGKVFDHGDKQNQDILSNNLEETTNPSDQEAVTLVEKAQTFLTDSVPRALEDLRNLAISDNESITPQPHLEVAIDHKDQGDVFIAQNPLGDLKDPAPIGSEGLKELAPSERVTDIIIQSSQQEALNSGYQGEGMGTHEALGPFPGRTVLAQGGSETLMEDTTETSDFPRIPENLNERSMQTPVNLAVGTKRPSYENILPPVTATQKLVKPKKGTPEKVEEIEEAPKVIKVVKEGDTLEDLLLDVYGSASPSSLRFVLDHNRHIVNVRKIYPGQQIVFPPLNSVDRRKMPIDVGPASVSRRVEKLNSSQKIFARSSAQTMRNPDKNVVKRSSPYAVATVQEGDTLENLIKAVYGSAHPTYIQRVLDYNPQVRNPKKIYPGQDIAFPKLDKAVKKRAQVH